MFQCQVPPTPSPARPLHDVGQQLAVERPPGQLAFDTRRRVDGRVEIRVIDTRPEDPGWSVTVTQPGDAALRVVSVRDTAAFHDGRRWYDQEAELRQGEVNLQLSARPGHGLGIAAVVLEDGGSAASGLSISVF